MGILVVDDCEEGRSIFKAVLEEAGYNEVLVAESVAAALSILAISSPNSAEPAPVDLVLLDAVMPEIDGFTACKIIRSDSRYADIPIAIATSLDDMESVNQAFKSGATGYISKPMKRIDLVAFVRSSLKLKEERDRRIAMERELLHYRPLRF
jgi:sigma-B regulation protein RsbU (phosphoserine phosphatase)